MTYDVKEKIAKLEMKMYELTSEATTLEQEYNQLKTMEKCASRDWHDWEWAGRDGTFTHVHELNLRCKDCGVEWSYQFGTDQAPVLLPESNDEVSEE